MLKQNLFSIVATDSSWPIHEDVTYTVSGHMGKKVNHLFSSFYFFDSAIQMYLSTRSVQMMFNFRECYFVDYHWYYGYRVFICVISNDNNHGLRDILLHRGLVSVPMLSHVISHLAPYGRQLPRGWGQFCSWEQKWRTRMMSHFSIRLLNTTISLLQQAIFSAYTARCHVGMNFWWPIYL